MPMKRAEYPENWEWLSRQVRKRNNGRCELCFAPNGFTVTRDQEAIDGNEYPWRHVTETDLVDDVKTVKIILTVHHIDGNKKNSDERNLISLCQRCHLRLDLEKHMRKRKSGGKNDESKILLGDGKTHGVVEPGGNKQGRQTRED